MTHMWDKRGYFYYQVLPFCTIKISYMRWVQAWMLLALSTLLQDIDQGDGKASAFIQSDLASSRRRVGHARH